MSQQSWEGVAQWYDQLQRDGGDWTHKLVTPFILNALNLDKEKPLSFLEFGCGQGVFARCLPKQCTYTGIDISPSLIQKAKNYRYAIPTSFHVQDVSSPFDLKQSFDRTLFLLSLQNMKKSKEALINCRKHTKSDGRAIFLLNHPAFRIPRQTSWGIDSSKKLQYRRIDRYMSPMEIPIDLQPSASNPTSSVSAFHKPLGMISKELYEAGFSILWMEEICSDKISRGLHAKMENRAREEFPLFLMIVALPLDR